MDRDAFRTGNERMGELVDHDAAEQGQEPTHRADHGVSSAFGGQRYEYHQQEERHVHSNADAGDPKNRDRPTAVLPTLSTCATPHARIVCLSATGDESPSSQHPRRCDEGPLALLTSATRWNAEVT